MNSLNPGRLSNALAVLALAIALALIPQFARATPAGAQATTSNVTVCGVVSAFMAATPAAAGSVTFGTGGPTFALASGTTVGMASTLGTNVCIVAITNSTNQITSAFVFANPAPVANALTICGFITASGTDSLSIGGATFTFASGGAAFTGVPLTTPGPLCLTLTRDATGQVMSGVASTSFVLAPQTVCGPVTQFLAATSTAPGTITINGNALTIAAGITFTGTTIAQGSPYCLVFIFGPGGQVISGRASIPLAATPHYTPQRHHGAGGPTIDDQKIIA
ncbi:MAG: hypothetical protein NVSMB22_22550 [Chloroflexota bacterium]